MGLGVAVRPEILGSFPDLVKNMFGSAMTTGGLMAIVLNLYLPQSLRQQPPERGVMLIIKCKQRKSKFEESGLEKTNSISLTCEES